jgi:hypothetical protein
VAAVHTDIVNHVSAPGSSMNTTRVRYFMPVYVERKMYAD